MRNYVYDNRCSVFDLINTSRCPKASGAQSDSRAPALCLICGAVVCSQSYCCQTEIDGETVGACTAHSMTCGAGIGLYLRWVFRNLSNVVLQTFR